MNVPGRVNVRSLDNLSHEGLERRVFVRYQFRAY